MSKFNYDNAQGGQYEFMRNPFKPDMVSVWGARILAGLYVSGAIFMLGVAIRELIKSR